MLRKNGVNHFAQSTRAFSVNDADLENAPLTTGLKVIRDQVFHIPRLERVQIQHPINRHLNGLVHSSKDFNKGTKT